MWILIIWAIGGYNGTSPAITTQEFNSEASCRSALVVLKEVSNGELRLRGVCTPKD